MALIKRRLEEARRILLITHISPDGDAIGSLLGLGWALRPLKKVTMACADPVPSSYTYLPGSQAIMAQPAGWYDLVISLDASDLERLGSAYDPVALAHTPLINIDHHVTNVHFGTINWVDPSAAATAELVLELVEYLGIPLNPNIATCLLNGIVTDTRGFRTSTTSLRTMEAVVKLMKAGAPLTQVTDRVFSHKPLSTIRLWGRVLGKVRMEDGILWGEIPRALREECQVSGNDDLGLSSLLATVEGVKVAVIFSEREDGRVDVGLRSVPGVDVASIALQLGGGGHPQAAGCLLSGTLPEVREKVLAAIRHSLRGQRGHAG